MPVILSSEGAPTGADATMDTVTVDCAPSTMDEELIKRVSHHHVTCVSDSYIEQKRPARRHAAKETYYAAKETYYAAKETYYAAKETYYAAKETYYYAHITQHLIT